MKRKAPETGFEAEDSKKRNRREGSLKGFRALAISLSANNENPLACRFLYFKQHVPKPDPGPKPQSCTSSLDVLLGSSRGATVRVHAVRHQHSLELDRTERVRTVWLLRRCRFRGVSGRHACGQR